MSHSFTATANRIPNRKLPAPIARRMKSMPVEGETTAMLRDMALVLKLTARIREEILEEAASRR